MLPRSHRLPTPEIPNIMRRGTRVAGNGFSIVYRIQNKELRIKNPDESEDKNNGNTEYGIRNTDPKVHDSRNHGQHSQEDSGNQCSRFAFIVSTKVDKRAVVRNRIKRILRESIAHLMPRFTKPMDCVCIGSRGLAALSQKEAEARVMEVVGRMGF